MKTVKEVIKEHEKKSRKEILTELGHLTVEQFKLIKEVAHLKKENNKLWNEVVGLSNEINKVS